MLLDKYGMYGKNFATKRMPNNYQDWDAESIAQFISGLWTADGHISIHKSGELAQATLAVSNLELIKQVRDMLHKFWAIPLIHIGVQHRIMPSGYRSTIYRLSYQNPIIVEKLLKNVIRPLGIKAFARREVLSWLSTRQRVTVRNPYKCPRISQEYLGMQPVMDIEVDNEDHLFLLANGIQCHNSKHSGGVGGKKVVDPEGEDQPTGFKSIERMFMAPSNFPGGEVLAPVDGMVNAIKPAAQGGNYITVGTQTMYCSPERTFKVHVGDKVSAGDVLTNGVPNPAEIMRYKGVGAGRQYYVGKLADIFSRAGFGVDRSNLESFTRAMLNKVRIGDDGYRDWLPGEYVSYSEVAADWKPRDNAVKTTVDKAANMYLEEPVLNYTIGTRITPDVAKNLSKYGFKDVTVNSDPPPFNAEFMRPAQALQNDRNWLPRLAGERLRDGLFDAARKGITDSYDSPSYVDKIVAAPFK
jgi:hypothetical protein